jgi:hypothetical protein
MKGSKLHLGGMVRLFLVLAVAGLASGAALATDYIVIQPIDVCSTNGLICAPFNSLTTNPNPDKATLSTPIGWIDSRTGGTNANYTRLTLLQAGHDVLFLPMVRYNNSTYQNINDVTCTTTGGMTTCDSAKLNSLASGTPSGFPAPDPNCKTACFDPMDPSQFPNVTAANAIPMFFVNSIGPGTYYGFSKLCLGGIVIASNTFSTLRIDTLAHEVGHNLCLDHTTFGDTSPGIPSNLMTAGTTSSGAPFRIVPTVTTASNLSTGLTDLMNMTADQLLVDQQNKMLQSSLLNPQQNTGAAAGGGDPPYSLPFTIFNNGGGRVDPATGLETGFIMGAVFAFPKGIKPNPPNPYLQTGGAAAVANFQIIHGSNGPDNPYPLICLPSITCWEFDFTTGTFAAKTEFDFTLNFSNSDKNISCADLNGGHLIIINSDLTQQTLTFDSFCNASSSSPDPAFPLQLADSVRFAPFGAPSSFTGANPGFPCTLPPDDSPPVPPGAENEPDDPLDHCPGTPGGFPLGSANQPSFGVD